MMGMDGTTAREGVRVHLQTVKYQAPRLVGGGGSFLSSLYAESGLHPAAKCAASNASWANRLVTMVL